MEGARFAILFLLSISLLSVSKVQDKVTNTVYIVVVNQLEGIQLEAFSLKTLSAILGNMKAAKKALIYTYEHAMNGFAAHLTPKQASKILQQPGVLTVIKDRSYNLTSPVSNVHTGLS